MFPVTDTALKIYYARSGESLWRLPRAAIPHGVGDGRKRTDRRRAQGRRYAAGTIVLTGGEEDHGGTNIYDTIAPGRAAIFTSAWWGPVRTGKSTFIKRFMDTLVIPHIDSAYKRDRATDELPQSAAGAHHYDHRAQVYSGAGGEHQYRRNGQYECPAYRLRGVHRAVLPGIHRERSAPDGENPWYDEEIPFNMAAEIGTRKVITEHSTIGLVITTDGSISEIPGTNMRKRKSGSSASCRRSTSPLSCCSTPWTRLRPRRCS